MSLKVRLNSCNIPLMEHCKLIMLIFSFLLVYVISVSYLAHRDWNSRVYSPGGILLREFVSPNSCIVHGLYDPITVSNCPTHTLDVLGIVVVKNFVQWTWMSAQLHSAQITFLSLSTFRVDHPSLSYQKGNASND